MATIFPAFLAISSCSEESAKSPAVLPTSEVAESVISAKREAYRANLEALETDRVALREELQNAASSGKTAVIAKARQRLLRALIEDIFPAWYGTTWAFGGVSQQPGEGQIACGYFVTTCLRDAGFRLERVKLAQQPSQRIITTLTTKPHIKLFYDKPMDVIAKHLRDTGPGLYVVGLDQHTGFVVNDGEKLSFVHSSYFRPPFSVTAEPIEGWNPLAKSRYRVFGRILTDETVRRWIQGEKFPLRR